MDAGLQAEIFLARLLEAAESIGTAVGRSSNRELARATERRLGFVQACPKHHGYAEAIEPEHRG